MKTNWQTKKLGEICEVVGGGTPKTTNIKYWDGNLCWVTPKDLGKLSGFEIVNTKRKISEEGLKNSSAKLLPVGSVILSSRAPIGYVVINGVEMATNQGCKSFICGPEIYNKYLYYFFVSNTEYLNSLGSGTTFKEVSGSVLKNIDITFPELFEQKRIANILDGAFEKIAKAKENAEKNLQNSRELFESALQCLFNIPATGWKVGKIEDFIHFIDYRGKTPKKTEAGIRLITAKNIKMGYIKRDPEEFIDPDNYESWMTRGIPQKGDVLFTTEAPLAMVAQLDTNEKVAFAQRTIIFQTDSKKLDATFLKYLLMSKPIQNRIIEKGTGATVQGIKASLLKKIEIYFPESTNEQKIIVSKLNSLSEQTKKLQANYKQKIADLAELKMSLLTKAFAGEL